jgi:putative oxygen-independent coproporphyrinogen III oxidase
MAGLYVHIPFCTSRCIYCGFYSTTLSSLQDRYIDAVCQEMMMREKVNLTTVYIGGGTPSTLSKENLDKLFLYINKVYGLSSSMIEGENALEITMECNPDDVCKPDFYLPPQVNRVSMGAQTFSDDRLRLLHRRHNAEEIRTAVSLLRHKGIRNISVDLMFGFPNETLEDWTSDLEEALKLDVEHISAYSLMYEKGTPLYRMQEEGKVKEISDDLSLQMYDALIDRLEAAGYEHYEISNFAKKGFRSKHNSSYWQQIPYIGIGAAAHSYDLKTRQWNVADIQAYIKGIEAGKRPFEKEVIDDDTRYDDIITTALRTKEGIDLKSLSLPYREYLLKQAENYITRHLLKIEGDKLSLTRKGIYISDSIMSDLMHV